MHRLRCHQMYVYERYKKLIAIAVSILKLLLLCLVWKHGCSHFQFAPPIPRNPPTSNDLASPFSLPSQHDAGKHDLRQFNRQVVCIGCTHTGHSLDICIVQTNHVKGRCLHGWYVACQIALYDSFSRSGLMGLLLFLELEDIDTC